MIKTESILDSAEIFIFSPKLPQLCLKMPKNVQNNQTVIWQLFLPLKSREIECIVNKNTITTFVIFEI